MNAEEQILTELRQREAQYKNATKFAQALGVSLSQWTRTKYGERRLGALVANAAVHMFPDLEPLTVIFLRHELTTRKHHMPMSKSA